MNTCSRWKVIRHRNRQFSFGFFFSYNHIKSSQLCNVIIVITGKQVRRSCGNVFYGIRIAKYQRNSWHTRLNLVYQIISRSGNAKIISGPSAKVVDSNNDFIIFIQYAVYQFISSSRVLFEIEKIKRYVVLLL